MFLGLQGLERFLFHGSLKVTRNATILLPELVNRIPETYSLKLRNPALELGLQNLVTGEVRGLEVRPLRQMVLGLLIENMPSGCIKIWGVT